jgi:hypothetical protein
MRALGHFSIFLGFFVLLAIVLGLLVAGAVLLRSTLVLLMLLPVLPGLWMLYTRSYRALVAPRDGGA